MKGSILLALLPAMALALASSDPGAAKEVKTLADAGYTPKDIELMRKALDQTPAEDRVFILARVIKIGILSALLAGPAFAASLIPLALVPLILCLKHKIPPVNVIHSPPPAPYDPPEYSPPAYSPPAYSPPAYSPPPQAPPAYSPPAYGPPQVYDSYGPPAAPPIRVTCYAAEC